MSGKTAAELIDHFRNPGAKTVGGAVPQVHLTTAEANGLALFFLKLTPTIATDVAAAPPFALQRAILSTPVPRVINGVVQNVAASTSGMLMDRIRHHSGMQ